MKRRFFLMTTAAALTLIPGLTLEAQQGPPPNAPNPGNCPNCPNGGIPKRDGTGPGRQKGNRGGPMDGTGPLHPDGGGGGGGRRGGRKGM